MIMWPLIFVTLSALPTTIVPDAKLPVLYSITFFCLFGWLVLLNSPKFIQLRKSSIFRSGISSDKGLRSSSPKSESTLTYSLKSSQTIGPPGLGEIVMVLQLILSPPQPVYHSLLLEHLQGEVRRQADLTLNSVSCYLWIMSEFLNLPESQFLHL